MGAFRQLRLLLYPRRCPYCGRVLGRVIACPDCAPALEELRRKPSQRLRPERHYLGNLEGAAAPYRYEGRVRTAILRAKYGGAPWVADELGLELPRLLFGTPLAMRGMEPQPEKAEWAKLGYGCIVPVPSSGRARGYNVPERMARPLARALDLPLYPHALCRTRRKRRQEGLTLPERLANVAGAFAATDPELVAGKQVLLVDDVITTGATAVACAQALLAAGAESVFAVALATVEFDVPVQSKGRIEENAGENAEEFAREFENL